MKISVVIPCLNENKTIAACIDKALSGIRACSVSGEVIVADNGSTDGSQDIARSHGAKVVDVDQKGYGNALMGGISAAQGEYILMGDADLSYDFDMIPRFFKKIEEGYDLVQGCRLESGGGTVMPGAMPFLHRWVGNPFFSWMVRFMFDAPISDVNCGMRAFRKDHYLKLDQQCTGMEFAVEMVLKSSLMNARISQIPITLYPDGRQGGKPHLRTFRDGWRTLVFFLVSSPKWLFFYPGFFLFVLGLIVSVLGLFNVKISNVNFDINTFIFGALLIVCSFQVFTFAVGSKIYGMVTGLLPFKPEYELLFQKFNLEKGLIFGVINVLIGTGMYAYLIYQWWNSHFGALNAFITNRIAIIGMIFFTVGIQIIFTSFFFSILGLRFKKKSN